MDDTRVSSRAWKRLLALVACVLLSAALAWPPTLSGLDADALQLLAVLGAAVVLAIEAHRGLRAAEAANAPRAVPDPMLALEADPCWLHIVSAPDGAPLGGSAFAVAGALLSADRRVLLMDGGRRAALHALFGAAPSPGLVECLAGDATLESITGPARAGELAILPYGSGMRGERWPQLGRVLDEARSRFDRVVIALDFATPHEVGDALLGIPVRGWWCHGGRATRARMALAERLGISMIPLELPAEEELPLEAPAAPAPASRETPKTRLETLAVPGLEPIALPKVETPIMDCDLQVRERLRFLIWMRSVQSEGHIHSR